MGLSFSFQTFNLAWAAYQTGSVPYNNLYGSVLFLGWVLSLLLMAYGLNSTSTRMENATVSDVEASKKVGPFLTHIKKPVLHSSFVLRQRVFPTVPIWGFETKRAAVPSFYRNAACILSPLIFSFHVFCA